MSETDRDRERTLLGLLVENAVLKFGANQTATTQEGEIYPYNLSHASYEALMEFEDSGSKPARVFPVLARQSSVQAFFIPAVPIPEGLDIATILCIDIIRGEALKTHPELEAEDRQRRSGGSLAIHD